MTRPTHREKITDLIGLLCRSPRTVKELVALGVMQENNIYIWLKLLMEEGLVHGDGRGVYSWQYPNDFVRYTRSDNNRSIIGTSRTQ